MRILILPKAKYPPSRPMLNALWNTEISALDNTLFWIMQNEKTNLTFSKITWKNSIVYLIPSLRRKNLLFTLLDTLFNVVFKFFLSLIIIKKHSMHLLHVHDAVYEGILSIILSKLTRIKITYAYTSDFILTNKTRLTQIPRHRKALKKIQFAIEQSAYRKILRKTHFIFPISFFLMKKLNTTLRIPNKKMMVVSEAASTCFLTYASFKKSTVNNPKKIIYVGSLGRKRNIPFIIDTVRLVIKKYSNVQLILLGWPEQHNDIKLIREYSKRKSIEKKIRFLKKVSYQKVPEIVSKCDIGLSPIPVLEEYLISTPTKCIEYLSLKVPVVANSEIYDQKEILLNSKGGLLAEYDVGQFANAILKLLQNTQLMKECAVNGYEWIKKNRTFAAAAREINEQLINLVYE